MSCPQVQMTSPSLFPSPDSYDNDDKKDNDDDNDNTSKNKNENSTPPFRCPPSLCLPLRQLSSHNASSAARCSSQHVMSASSDEIPLSLSLPRPLQASPVCEALQYQRIKHQGLFRQAPNSKVPLPSDAATHVQIQTLLKCLESMDLRCRLFTLSPLSC